MKSGASFVNADRFRVRGESLPDLLAHAVALCIMLYITCVQRARVN